MVSRSQARTNNMRSFLRSVFSIPVLIIWALAVLSVGALGVASVLTSSNFGNWSNGYIVISYTAIKSRLQGTGIGFDQAFQFAAWVLPGLASVLTAILASRTKRDAQPQSKELPVPSNEKLAEQRSILIKNVGTTLANARTPQLYSKAFVELRKELSPSSVATHIQEPPIELPMSIFFERSQGRLLILGAPGAGKSTVLYELAEGLLRQTSKNKDTDRIPVIFRLSSFTDSGNTLLEWLVKQLNLSYGIRPEVSEYWLREDKLIIMLDGLDEIPSEGDRRKCLVAINEFVSNSSLRFAVSSRKLEYDAIGEKLCVGSAILLKPLDETQVRKFLRHLGNDGEVLSTIIHASGHEKLRELAQVPLLLNVMAASVRELKDVSFADNITIDEARTLVLDSFIRQILKSAQDRTGYRPIDIAIYLNYVANHLELNGHTIFFPRPWSVDMILPEKGLRVEDIVFWSIFITFAISSVGLLFYFRSELDWGISRPLNSVSMALIWISFVMFLLVTGIGTLRVMNKARELSPPESKAYLVSRNMFRVILCAFATFIVSLYGGEWCLYWYAGYREGLFGHLPEATPLPVYGTVSIILVTIAMALHLFLFRPLYLMYIGWIPRNMKRFLEACVSLKLIYRVPLGYSFLHKLLQEHFYWLDLDRLHLEDPEERHS